MENADEILAQWKEDGKIDTLDVDMAAINIPVIHQKYLDLFQKLIAEKNKLEEVNKKLRHKKKIYYSGQMSKEAMDKLGWDYNPYKGAMKPLKSEQREWIDVDDDVLKIQSRLDNLYLMIDVTSSILEQIKWRNQTIKNIIDYRRFMSGE